MGKSKNRKGHDKKVNAYKLKMKSQKETIRKKFIDSFMAQQQLEEYKTTRESDVDIDTTGLELEEVKIEEDIISELPDGVIIEDNSNI